MTITHISVAFNLHSQWAVSTRKFPLLIGADFYWNIVQNKIVQGNGLIAMESKIGYLLSGLLSSPQFEVADGEILHVGAFALTGTNIAQFQKLSLWVHYPLPSLQLVMISNFSLHT